MSQGRRNGLCLGFLINPNFGQVLPGADPWCALCNPQMKISLNRLNELPLAKREVIKDKLENISLLRPQLAEIFKFPFQQSSFLARGIVLLFFSFTTLASLEAIIASLCNSFPHDFHQKTRLLKKLIYLFHKRSIITLESMQVTRGIKPSKIRTPAGRSQSYMDSDLILCRTCKIEFYNCQKGLMFSGDLV